MSSHCNIQGLARYALEWSHALPMTSRQALCSLSVKPAVPRSLSSPPSPEGALSSVSVAGRQPSIQRPSETWDGRWTHRVSDPRWPLCNPPVLHRAASWHSTFTACHFCTHSPTEKAWRPSSSLGAQLIPPGLSLVLPLPLCSDPRHTADVAIPIVGSRAVSSPPRLIKPLRIRRPGVWSENLRNALLLRFSRVVPPAHLLLAAMTM